MTKPKTNKLIEEIVSLVNKWQTKSDYPYPPIRPLAKEISNLITQAQQETLEWCEKQIGECYKQGITTVQFKDGTSLIFTCQESLYDVNSFIKHLKQTIKQRKEGGK